MKKYNRNNQVPTRLIKNMQPGETIMFPVESDQDYEVVRRAVGSIVSKRGGKCSTRKVVIMSLHMSRLTKDPTIGLMVTLTQPLKQTPKKYGDNKTPEERREYNRNYYHKVLKQKRKKAREED